MTIKPLLPSGSTPLERAAASALAEAMAIDVPLRELADPARCPTRLLPYLAWAWSVDRWDESWPEATKRSVIAASFYVHQRKGTISALRRVVEPLGYLIEVIEWWQVAPIEQRGTFRLVVGVLEQGITDAMYRELERLIDDAKPVSRHLVGLAISLSSHGALRLGAAAYLGDELTVQAFMPTEIVISGPARTAGASHLFDTMSIHA